jgi:hypothetical protein
LNQALNIVAEVVHEVLVVSHIASQTLEAVERSIKRVIQRHIHNFKYMNCSIQSSSTNLPSNHARDGCSQGEGYLYRGIAQAELVLDTHYAPTMSLRL